MCCQVASPVVGGVPRPGCELPVSDVPSPQSLSSSCRRTSKLEFSLALVQVRVSVTLSIVEPAGMPLPAMSNASTARRTAI